jgi:hypothetical protein
MSDFFTKKENNHYHKHLTLVTSQGQKGK